MSITFDKYWEQIRDRLESEFTALVPEFFGTASGFPGTAVRRSLISGKRIRGCLVCLMCEALGGSLEAASAAAVGIECVQAASLIHDDYIDGDRTRRNRPAEWTVQGSRQAVLLGDLMFATVIHSMTRRRAAEGELIAKVVASMARGAYEEHLDRMQLTGEPGTGCYDPKRYEYIIGLKTGALFGTAAQLGAIAAGAGEPLQAQALRFGACLGEAYQIVDDLVEVTDLLGRAHCSDGEMAAVAPAWLYFTPADPVIVLAKLCGQPQADSAWLEREAPPVLARMRSRIAERIRSALTVLEPFPEGPCRDLLGDMSGRAIAAMTDPAELPVAPLDTARE